MIKKGLLKSLCILGLTLLPISFSNAGSTCMTFDIPDTFVLNKSTILSFNNLNFNTQINSNNLEHIIYLTVPSNASSSVQSLKSLFGYYNGQPYLYSAYHQSNSSNDIYQGFPTNVYVESVDTFDISHITYNAIYSNINSFLNARGFNGGLVCASDGGHLSDPFIYCFKNSTNYYCFKVSSYGGGSSNYTFNTLSGSLGLTTNSNFTNITSIDWSSSPISQYDPIPPYEMGEGTYTNHDIIDGYNAMGLSDGFCYGGFPITDLFNNGDDPNSWVGYQWGSGASILDIWDNYKTAYNNDYISFLRTFYLAYENKNYNSFYGYPKSLYSFFNQWAVVDISTVGFNSYMSDFSITDVWEYCNLKFNSDPNATYTGNSRKAGFAFDNRGNVSNKGRFDFSGNSLYFSGSLSGFNSASDFFGSLNSIFQNGLGSFGDIKQPLLPSYIIIFMLAIIFIRIISH